MASNRADVGRHCSDRPVGASTGYSACTGCLQHGNRIDGAGPDPGTDARPDEQERHEHPDHSEAEDQIAQSPLGPVIAHDPIQQAWTRSARPPRRTSLDQPHAASRGHGLRGSVHWDGGSGGRARLTGSDAPITVPPSGTRQAGTVLNS